MALIKCSECEKKISDKASFCPHCGYSNKPYTFCKNCGAKTVDDEFCTNCGVNMNDDISYSVTPKKKMCGLALAGGITGISSLIIDIIGLTAITAIVLSSIGLNKTKTGLLRGKGWAVCGLVCGIIELVFKAILIMYYFS